MKIRIELDVLDVTIERGFPTNRAELEQRLRLLLVDVINSGRITVHDLRSEKIEPFGQIKPFEKRTQTILKIRAVATPNGGW